MILNEATLAFLEELVRRNRTDLTIANYRSLFRSWIDFSRRRKLIDLADYDVIILREFHDSWNVQPSTAKTRLKMLRTFYTFAVDMDWIEKSPMSKLALPKVVQIPTLPLTRNEFQALAIASENNPGDYALILLMRYSGLSIGDAVGCRIDALNREHLTLHRSKTGEIVMVPLPALVMSALRTIKGGFGSKHFFWSGTTKPVSAAKRWRRRLQRIGHMAGLADFRPHQLRDTFAVELLLAGVAMQEVSSLLGHNSILTTERYYAPWNTARRDRLARIVKEVNDADPTLRLLNKRNRKQ